jgi:hypothetical protein
MSQAPISPLTSVLAYLVQRRSKAVPNATILARPSELLTVLLKSARFFSLEEAFDYEMSTFDHLTINAYIPNDYRFYSHPRISGGVNACFSIGHDIWTTSDLERAWPKEANTQPANSAIGAGAILSSMLFNDRIPWFLFAPQLPISV